VRFADLPCDLVHHAHALKRGLLNLCSSFASKRRLAETKVTDLAYRQGIEFRPIVKLGNRVTQTASESTVAHAQQYARHQRGGFFSLQSNYG